jgi:hypothetical protein
LILYAFNSFRRLLPSSQSIMQIPGPKAVIKCESLFLPPQQPIAFCDLPLTSTISDSYHPERPPSDADEVSIRNDDRIDCRCARHPSHDDLRLVCLSDVPGAEMPVSGELNVSDSAFERSRARPCGRCALPKARRGLAANEFSGWTASATDVEVPELKRAVSAPVPMSPARTLKSPEHERTYRPSRENIALDTGSVCPTKLRRHEGDPSDHSDTTRSLELPRKYRQCRSTATLRIGSMWNLKCASGLNTSRCETPICESRPPETKYRESQEKAVVRTLPQCETSGAIDFIARPTGRPVTLSRLEMITFESRAMHNKRAHGDTRTSLMWLL